MTKYIITKTGKEIKRETLLDTHDDIRRDNGLSYNDVIDEGLIIEGKHYSCKGSLPIEILKYRIVESDYLYNNKKLRGQLKEGD